jgi:hypothetical protein
LADETAKLAAEEEARRLKEEAEKKRQAEEAKDARKQQDKGKAIVTSDESDPLSILQDLQQRMHVQDEFKTEVVGKIANLDQNQTTIISMLASLSTKIDNKLS